MKVHLGRMMLVGTILIWAGGRARAASLYSVTDLGTLGGTTSSSAGISSNGAYVTGQSNNGSATHAFSSPVGGMMDLGTLDGTSTGYAINNSGQVAGYSNGHAFLYNGSTIQDLGTLSGATSLAYGINNNGNVVGYSNFAGGDSHSYHAFLYSSGAMTDLGALGGTSSYAAAINDSGQIAGYITPNSASTAAYLYSGGTETLLGTLGGSISSAAAISSNGYVAGSSTLSNGNTHAFLYLGGTLLDLGTLGGTTSRAAGVNSTGQVVGQSLFSGSGFDGFLYSNGVLTELNTLIDPNLGIRISNGTGITDTGLIAATGTVGGNTHAFLLTPQAASVPEPTTLAVSGVGALLCLLVNRSPNRSSRGSLISRR